MSTEHNVLTSVRLMRPSDLEMVLGWRNHDQVRQVMFSRELITFKQHVEWFDRASKEVDRKLLIFEKDNQALGFVNLGRVTSGGIVDWGFFLAPHAPKGTGRHLAKVVLSYAFNTLRLHKICGQVLDFNEKSIKFHLNNGFALEGVLRQQYFDGKQYSDIKCFGLLATDWLAQN